MEQYEKTIIPMIESIYENFTPLEKTIADFFINNKERLDFHLAISPNDFIYLRLLYLDLLKNVASRVIENSYSTMSVTSRNLFSLLTIMQNKS